MNRNQRGMTLIELILVVSIVGIIGAAGTTTYFQVVKGSGTSNNRALALSNIQRVADWFTKDALQARGRPNQINPPLNDPDPPLVLDVDWPVTFEWTDYGDDYGSSLDDYYYICTYSKEPSGDLKRIVRSLEKYDKDDSLVSQSITMVADKISLATCKYNWRKEFIILTVEATVGIYTSHEIIETRTYEIVSRERLGLGSWEEDS